MEAPPPVEERRLVDGLRAGDESAFTRLVQEYGPSMLRVARMYVSSRAVAEEVVQEAWVAVLNGIGRFEGRSSLKTWIFRILTNIAKTRGQREGRSVPFAALAGDDLDRPTWDPSAFRAPGEPLEGTWSSLPQDWSGVPEQQLLG